MNQFQDIIKKERKDAARLLKPYLCTELRINKKKLEETGDNNC